MGQAPGPVEPPFSRRLGQQGYISVPAPTMFWWVYNRYLPAYWPPYVPTETPPGERVELGFGGEDSEA